MVKILPAKHILEFYETLFKKRYKTLRQKWKIFSNVDIPKHSENRKKIYNYLKSMQNDRNPSSDGLTKEFYQEFWVKLKEVFLDSVSEAKQKGHLSTSQRQTIIGLIEKKIEMGDSFEAGHIFLR